MTSLPSTASRRPRRILLAAALGLLLGTWLGAQQTAPPGKPVGVVRVETRLVLVDVVATDKQGRPVTDLTLGDFTLLENGKPQQIATFSYEDAARQAEAQPASPPPLPAHVYTNRPEYRRPPGQLTLLLLDGLNTPRGDQAYARDQMLRYLKTQLKPDQHTAILTLTSQLRLLQDFTTDPRLLLNALAGFGGETSVALSRAEPLEIPPEAYQLMPADMMANIDRFQAEQETLATDSRVATTLEALRAVARATGGYPGRKNLIWVSASFPFTLLPEDSGNVDLVRSYLDEIRRTASLLTDAQVAVYPVDARGLVGMPVLSAASRMQDRSGRGLQGSAMADALSRSNQQLVSSQQTMANIAEETGGRAFTNRNDIDAAIATSVADGGTYYTLGYYPDNKAADGKLRRIEVKVARKGVKLRHRRGYYPTPRPTPGEKENKRAEREIRAALADPLPATGVTFLASVPPPTPGPPARVGVDFLVDARTLAFEETPESQQHCHLEFLAVAISPQGRVVTSAGHTVEGNLGPERYDEVRRDGLPYRLELELPPGRYRLRLLVRDNLSGSLGTLDVPLAVETLPELPAS